MRKLNVSQICSINAIVKAEHNWYKYRKECKFLGIRISKEGFYHTFSLSGGDYIERELITGDSRMFIEGKKVFWYPHLEITMSNEHQFNKFFKSKQELEDYIESEELKVNKWLCL
jgi:hypothetical protein